MISLSIILLFVLGCNGVVVTLNSPNQLQEYLVEHRRGIHNDGSTLLIQLNSSVVFTISTDLDVQCNQNKNQQVLITGCPSGSTVIIKCVTKQYNQLAHTGFIFKDCSMVTFHFISFIGCGLPLINNSTRTHIAPITPFMYHNDHFVVLMCISCHEFCLTNVSFVSSVGFSVIAINTVTVVALQSVTVTNNNSIISHKSNGSGIHLHYTSDCIGSQSNILINNALFYDIATNADYISPIITSGTIPDQIIPNAVGLSLLSIRNFNYINFTISDTTFTNNSGTNMLLVYYNTVKTVVHICNVVFNHNNRLYNDSAAVDNPAVLQFFLFNTVNDYSHPLYLPLVANNVLFTDNIGIQLVTIYVCVIHGLGIEMQLVKVSFVNNSLSDGTTIMAVVNPFDYTNDFNLIIDNMTATNNYPKYESVIETSVLEFSHVGNISFLGNSNFQYNIGSVLRVIDSALHLYDRFICNNNRAHKGGCINARGWSYIHFHNKLVATFSSNSAIVSGGVIFAESNLINTVQLPQSCVFQFDSYNSTSLIFSDNHAKVAGSAIYAEPIFNCSVFEYNRSISYTLGDYKKFMIFWPESNSKLNNISTIPKHFQVIIDGGQATNLNKIYPGWNLSLTLRSVDVIGRSVHSTVRVTCIVTDQSMIGFGSQFKQSLVFEVPEYDKDNAIIDLSINTLSPLSTAMVLFEVIENPTLTKLFNVSFQPNCSFGFSFNHVIGGCECEKPLTMFPNILQSSNIKFSCNKYQWELSRIFVITNTWLGLGMNNSIVQFSLSCLPEQCNADTRYIAYVINDQGVHIADNNNNTNSVCLYNRVGVLCGECEKGKSLTLGSAKCKECSNWWLLLIPIPLSAGVILVFIIYITDLTLWTGRFNSIIFFSQISHAGLFDIISYSHIYSNTESLKFMVVIGSVLLEIMGLGFGSLSSTYSICLFNGMRQTHILYISILTPIYFLLLVVVVGIASRKCMWLSTKIASSSVQVIVTIAHLTFSQLLQFIIDVFTSAKVYNNSQSQNEDTIDIVWYFDGSERFMRGNHRILAIVCIVLGAPLIFTYFFFLLFTKTLLKHSLFANTYLRPFYEAIHAPYKPSKEYFFTLRLIKLIVIYVVYAFYRASNPLAIYAWTTPLLIIYLILQVTLKPYKRDIITFIDSLVVFSEIITYLVTWNYMNPMLKSQEKAAIVCLVEIFFVFSTFVLIFTYHMLKHRQRLVLVECLHNNRLIKRVKTFLLFDNNRNNTLTRIGVGNDNDPYYSSCSHFREPILSVESQ